MSKLLDFLYEKVDKRDLIYECEGINGVIAMTKTMVYLVRGGALERKAIKTYSLKNIISIETRKPNLLTNGHFQLITSGNNDRTKRFSTAFDYAKDENTVMLRSHHYDDFARMEKLIYQYRDQEPEIIQPAQEIEEDIFEKIEKLNALFEKKIISSEDYEQKKAELLSRI